MRKKIVAVVALGLGAAQVGTLVWATADLDLSDFNDDVMRDMDDTVKRLDSGLATKDAVSAAADARAIQEGLKWAQDYFAKKGNVEDAVKLAKQGEDRADAVARSVQAGDFDSALTNYESLVKTCRACHDAYKPPDI